MTTQKINSLRITLIPVAIAAALTAGSIMWDSCGSATVPLADVKNVYEMVGKILGPRRPKLDCPYIEKTRPEIAAMLK